VFGIVSETVIKLRNNYKVENCEEVIGRYILKTDGAF
jgi:hypothetical protein